MSCSGRALEPAEIKKLDAETQVALAKTRGALAKAAAAEIALEREREEREDELADNSRHRVYLFDSEVSDRSVKDCITQLTTWSRQNPGCAIEIQLNSPGGSIMAGFALIDVIRELRHEGHEVTMVGLGMVASMAGVLMQAADKRVIGKHAFLLIHEGSFGAVGDFGEVEDRVELMQLMHEHILGLFEERAKPINPKTTSRFIRNRWKRKDWWITAEKARDLGFVDEVR